jgi:hypothetical protein
MPIGTSIVWADRVFAAGVDGIVAADRLNGRRSRITKIKRISVGRRGS